MTTKKLIAATAMAALAVPASAVADGSDRDRSHGKANAQKAKAKKAKKAKKGSAFTLKGISASNLTVTDGKLAGPFTLDPTSANRFARAFLKLSKAELRSTETVTLGSATDAVRITYVGLTAGSALQPTDTVKVIGRVKDGGLDVRKLVVERDSDDSDKSSDSDK